MRKSPHSVRVLFCCTGVGIFNRGLESFFREAFDGLKGTPGLEAWLIKGKGERKENEFPVWCLPRTGQCARWLGKMFNRSAYAAEQWSSFFPVVREIRRLRPDVIFYSDANLGFQLFFRRQWIGVPYRLLYSNGGPVSPPFDRTDFVHQVAPAYHQEALAAGEPERKHFMVPYGIHVPPLPRVDPEAKAALRRRLNLPCDPPVVLSVGWISREHKRMHYVVEELSRLPEPRPFLQLLGAMDDSSREVLALADRLLGPKNYSARSVPYAEVSDFYRAADVFVLGSLREGFGRVYLEALMHGLPVIAHQHPVMDYVLGGQGILGDLSRPHELTALLSRELQTPRDDSTARERWETVRRRFSWPELAEDYLAMFNEVLEKKEVRVACESR